MQHLTKKMDVGKVLYHVITGLWKLIFLLIILAWLARLIDYIFPTSDIHTHFATLYKVDYKKSKELTVQTALRRSISKI